jgi:signal transduction histidine kinase
MKKMAVVFVVAVFAPSLVLAWLAVRSLRDQEYLLERQQSLLYQGVADAAANEAQAILTDAEHEFTSQVGILLSGPTATNLQRTFDDLLRQHWRLAQVGFVVTTTGNLVCPSPFTRPDTRMFCDNNGTFLSCRESAEVYWNNTKQGGQNVNESASPNNDAATLNQAQANIANAAPDSGNLSNFKSKGAAFRNVIPQQQPAQMLKGQPEDAGQSLSKIAASEAEFCQLIGTANDGMLARFVDNKLNLLFWARYPQSPQFVFGAQVSLARLVETLRPAILKTDPELTKDICLALLDDNARPVALSQSGFRANWKRPFAATEIGEALPHWELAVYLLNPAKLTESARTLKFTFGFLIALLVVAIGVGSWLIVADLNRQLTLARQKTDFVSNVSHELKTPLTSIRMFSELLAQGRIADPAKQQSYLGIITAEAARLTRLINNVLDFARLERGEKKYHFQSCDLADVVRETTDAYRPHLEANGFRFDCELPSGPVLVNGDRDALAQVVVNLLSNAEKYSGDRKEIELRIPSKSGSPAVAEVSVEDRGLGVPRGCEERIFEQFYRAHDCLSSGIQGSGLGLTLARQIARAHGGEITYGAREGGGSCFTLRLPLQPNENENPDC